MFESVMETAVGPRRGEAAEDAADGAPSGPEEAGPDSLVVRVNPALEAELEALFREVGEADPTADGHGEVWAY